MDYILRVINEIKALTVFPDGEAVAIPTLHLINTQISFLFIFQRIDFHQLDLAFDLIHVIDEVKLIFDHQYFIQFRILVDVICEAKKVFF